MPFTAPFHDRFEQGDLVYGLREPRGAWLFKHGAIRGKNWIDKYDLVEGSARNGDWDEAFIGSTLRHPKYKAAVKRVGENRKTEGDQHFWRTKSKAGLWWAVQDGKNVHFILDELKMTDVINKSNSRGNPDSPQGKAPAGTPQGDKVRTITNAELRWIYRYRNYPNVAELVQFWFQDNPCLPPWDASWPGNHYPGNSAKLWNNYVPTHNHE